MTSRDQAPGPCSFRGTGRLQGHHRRVPPFAREAPPVGVSPTGGTHQWGYTEPGPASEGHDLWPAPPCPRSARLLKTVAWLLRLGCIWERESRWHGLCFL